MKKIMMAVLVTWCLTLYPADSLKVVWGMLDYSGSEFTAEKLVNVTFKAWITNSAEEYISTVSTELDAGNKIVLYGDIRGACIIDFSNFSGWSWKSGDKFHLLIKDYNWSKDESFYEAYENWIIPENADTVYEFGFEDYTGYGGLPIINWSIYTVITDVYIGVVNFNGEIFNFSVYPYD
jgi:hypothetical protein